MVALETSLSELLAEMAADWEVLLWLLRANPLDLMRQAKAAWEDRQATLAEPWLVGGRQ